MLVRLHSNDVARPLQHLAWPLEPQPPTLVDGMFLPLPADVDRARLSAQKNNSARSVCYYLKNVIAHHVFSILFLPVDRAAVVAGAHCSVRTLDSVSSSIDRKLICTSLLISKFQPQENVGNGVVLDEMTFTCKRRRITFLTRL